jgi:energy-converting hydrogenase Eha subunit E
MMEFLSFRRMLIPYLIQIIFWAGTALCIFGGVMVMADKASAPIVAGVHIENRLLAGALILLGGPIVLRIWCEIAVVLFRMNETLTEMSGSRGGKK